MQGCAGSCWPHDARTRSDAASETRRAPQHGAATRVATPADIEPFRPRRFRRATLEGERPALLLRAPATAVEVRYLVDEPVRRSWEFRFKPELTPEELCAWLVSLTLVRKRSPGDCHCPS